MTTNSLMHTLVLSLRLKYWAVALAGALLALCSWKIMALETRYAIAIVGGILLFSIAMMTIYRIEDFLLYTLIFNIPFSRFAKWLFAQQQQVAAKGISLGLAEMLLLMASIAWFVQIFIIRKKKLPTLQKVDYLIILLLFTEFISLLSATNKLLGAFDIIYVVKHALMYFIIAHKIKRHHLKWVVVIIAFAICFESMLGFYERISGKMGFGLAKGAIKSSTYGSQFKVPGIEEEVRAAGTTNDPHSLGLYFAMILPIPFVLIAMDFLKPSAKFLLTCTLLAGVVGLILTFARAGWLSFAISTTFAAIYMTLSWKRAQAFFIFCFIALGAICFYPNSIKIIYNRLFEAPSGLIEERFAMNKSALNIWGKNFLFGAGPGNYMEALDDADVLILGREGVPVHNAYLYTASEIGLCGLITFYGIIITAMFRCFKTLKCEDPFIRGLSLAILAGFFSYLLDGLTNPMFKATVPYAQLWVYIALAMSFTRLLAEREAVLESNTTDGRFVHIC